MVAEVLRVSPQATLAIWAPIKDLDGFYGIVEGIHDAADGAPVMLAQSRLRPLTNPMSMNGSGMIVINPPESVVGSCDTICRWTAEYLGERGALGRAEMM
jgi:23S rRNA (adenine2030-N6)-methyltransferase